MKDIQKDNKDSVSKGVSVHFDRKFGKVSLNRIS